MQRLLVRGLIVVGTGDTEYDALYDLLSCRFIIPIGAAWPLRVLSFLVLFFADDDDRAGAFFGAAADITAIGSVKHFHKGTSKF